MVKAIVKGNVQISKGNKLLLARKVIHKFKEKKTVSLHLLVTLLMYQLHDHNSQYEQLRPML